MTLSDRVKTQEMKMSYRPTEFAESNVLLAMMNGDVERALESLETMSTTGVQALAAAAANTATLCEQELERRWGGSNSPQE
jgi:hypothetical protein